MAITYTIDTELKLVTTTATGAITLAEYQSYLDRRQADPAYDPKMCGIFDARGAKLAFTAADMREMADIVKDHLPDSCTRRAIVVSSDLDFGLARMFQALADDRRLTYGVFKDFDKALAWATRHQSEA
jgi:hypothetical protein